MGGHFCYGAPEVALSVDQVYRDYNTHAVPSSGDHKPRKGEVRALLKQIQNSGGQAVTRNTFTALDGVTPPNEDYMGVVLADADPAKNGYYSRVAGEWVWQRGFPDSVARLMITGGTQNAVEASSLVGVDPGSATLFLIDVEAPNSGAVTISINGAGAVNALSIDGDDFEPGEFIGRLTFTVEDDGSLRATSADPGVIAALVEEATSVAPSTWQTLRDETVAARNNAQAADIASADSADRSELAAQAAELARDSSFATAKGAATVGAARALVADNETFIVYEPGAASFAAYRRETVGQTLLGYYAGLAAFDDFKQTVQIGDNIDLVELGASHLIAPGETVIGTVFQDEAGNAPHAVLADGTVVTKTQRVGALELGIDGTLINGGETDWHWSVTDEANNPIIGIRGTELIGFERAAAVADVANQLAAASLQSAFVSGLQQPTADINMVLSCGQSLGQGLETWPSLSKTNRFNNLMLGGSVAPNSTETSYVQIAPTGLQPLVSNVLSLATYAVIDDAATAALTPGDLAIGEAPVTGMVNAVSHLIARRLMGPPNPFLVATPAIGGRTIEQLSKINGQDSTDRYARMISAVSQAQAAAAGAGKSFVVTAVVWMQGEWDYNTANGSANATKALYKAALEQLWLDLVADIKGITGQTDDPAFLLYQTGGTFTADADMNGLAGLHVGMAQLEFALEHPTKVFLAGPIYPVTDKGGHLDSNGSRWFGEAFLAKAYHHTVVEGRRWRPLSPTKIEQTSPSTILVHFHVPSPPLAFASNYTVNAATDYTDRGFRVTDSIGAVPIVAIDLVGRTMVRITLGRVLGSSPHVWYAPKATANGNGNLRDSDPFETLDRYEYSGGTGQYASANIAALIDKPYPAQNACVAFYLPVGYAE